MAWQRRGYPTDTDRDLFLQTTGSFRSRAGPGLEGYEVVGHHLTLSLSLPYLVHGPEYISR